MDILSPIWKLRTRWKKKKNAERNPRLAVNQKGSRAWQGPGPDDHNRCWEWRVARARGEPALGSAAPVQLKSYGPQQRRGGEGGPLNFSFYIAPPWQRWSAASQGSGRERWGWACSTLRQCVLHSKTMFYLPVLQAWCLSEATSRWDGP